MSRGSEARRRRSLTRQFGREATGGLRLLDIVHVTDPSFAPAIYAWAEHATADEPAICLICGDARFGPGRGLPRLMALIRAVGGKIAMAGGICDTCADQADLERTALAAFGFTGKVRLIDAAHISATEGRA